MAKPKHRPRRKKEPRWNLQASLWAERADAAVSGDYFETPAMLRKMFDLDWEMAVKSHDLGFYIVKCHHDPTTWRDIDKNGVHDEIDEVKDALFKHVHMIYGAFDYCEQTTDPPLVTTTTLDTSFTHAHP